MSSTTIRYSGVPENSHSRRFDSGNNSGRDSNRSSEPTSDITADSTSYTRPAPAGGIDRGPESDLTLKWRKRLRALADPETAPEQHAGSADRSAAPAAGGFVPGFAPGKAAPVSDDPRHNRAFPHPQNPGLFAEPDGFYDWANRRLYLADGSPDPMTPGAYRYQTRPDLCDLDAPDSSPSSPRYEPMHLRHKPGDTYLIDRDRPYDVLDPGPFGSPGWFPDPRTGRHRRNELPDPIPWWEIEEEPEKAEWAEHAEALLERRTLVEAEARRPWARGSDDSSDDDPPEPPSRQPRPEDRPDRQPRPGPRPRDRREAEAEAEVRQGASDRSRRLPHPPRQADRRSTRPPEEPPHRFNKLREDAWDRFIEKSADLAAAHRSQTAIEREGGPTIGRIARGIHLIAGLLHHRPRPRGAEPVPPDRHTALADRTARFAQAMRGAQRARTALHNPEVPAPGRPGFGSEATRRTSTPAPSHQTTSPGAARWTPPPEASRRTDSSSRAGVGPFIAEWERRFNPRDHLSGGAAWA